MTDPTDLPVPALPPTPRPRIRWRAALFGGAAVVLVGGLAITGTAAAAPAGSTTAGTSTAAAALGAGWWAELDCTDLQRVHTWVQDRIDVIGGDASVRGSTAWAQAALDTANAAGRTARAARLQKLLDARAAHPDRWQRVLTRVEGAEATACS